MWPKAENALSQQEAVIRAESGKRRRKLNQLTNNNRKLQLWHIAPEYILDVRTPWQGGDGKSSGSKVRPSSWAWPD